MATHQRSRLHAYAALAAAALFGAVVASGAQKIDLKAARAAITAADRQFNQAVADRDMSRFLSFIADDSTFNGGTPDEMHGKDAVAKGWAPFFRMDGPRLTWEPKKAEVLVGGDVGYTVGTWQRRPEPAAAPGSAKVIRGNYLTVWRKQTDGSWRVVFDTGSTEP